MSGMTRERLWEIRNFYSTGYYRDLSVIGPLLAHIDHLERQLQTAQSEAAGSVALVRDAKWALDLVCDDEHHEDLRWGTQEVVGVTLGKIRTFLITKDKARDEQG